MTDQSSNLFGGTFLEGIEVHTLSSAATGAAYRVTVSPPLLRGEPGKRHPLLIVLDGCMNFATAVESVRVQAMTGTSQDLIVVGVSTAGALAGHNLRRLRDYSPAGVREDDPAWKASPIGQVLMGRFAAAGLTLEQASGGAAAFQEFLISELLPYLAERCPVNPAELGLLGHSMAGAFASHALLSGSPFNKLIMGSFGVEMYGETLPALKQAFISNAARLAGSARPQVFSAVGSAELDDPRTRAGMGGGMEMLQRLHQAAPDAFDLTCMVFPTETHGSMMAHLISSGVRLLWPSGKTYFDSLPARMGGKAAS